MTRVLIGPLLLISGLPAGARAAAPCPAAERLPQLTIDEIEEPVIPVIDTWQVFWGNVPISDNQLALLAGADALIDRTEREMRSRGAWVYIGMGTAAGGAALSSIGWLLYGQDELSQSITLPMAAGGLLIGIAGTLVVTESVQTPLEPLTAPTPVHRLTRKETRELVAAVNRNLYRQICMAADARPGATRSPSPPDEELQR